MIILHAYIANIATNYEDSLPMLVAMIEFVRGPSPALVLHETSIV